MNKGIKILLDITNLLNTRGGIHYHLDGLIPELSKIVEREGLKLNFIYYFFRNERNTLPEYIKPESLYKYRFPVKLLNKLWIYFSFPDFSIKFPDVKVYHSPHFSLPVMKNAAKILTVHDITYNLHPEFFNPAHKKLNEYGYKQLLPVNLKRADHIIAISEFTRSNIIEYFKIEPHKITTVYTGTDKPKKISETQSEKYLSEVVLEKNEYIFFPAGTIEPRKNIPMTIQAFEDAGLPENLKLVVSGIGNIKELGSFDSRKVKFIKWSTILQRDILYQNSLFVVYPSLYEGFGMPAVEAMSMGKALLTSDTTALKEIANGFAYMVNPHCKDEIKEGIRYLFSNNSYRKELEKLSARRARDFSWQKMAEDTFNVYRKFL